MTVFKVLAKVVCSKEVLGLVTLAKLVHKIEVLGPSVPVGGIRELLAAITAHVRPCGGLRLGGVERRLYTRQRSAGPRVQPCMERVLMSFGLSPSSEAVRAVLAAVLLFELMQPNFSCQCSMSVDRVG